MTQTKKSVKKIMLSAAVSMVLLSLTGCATVFGDNTRTVHVDSCPHGAGIYVEGVRRGTTPASITLPNYIYGGKNLILKKEGYHEQVMAINTKFQPVGLWNILCWPGFIVDGVTGNTVKIHPTQLDSTVQLQPVDSTVQLQPVDSTVSK